MGGPSPWIVGVAVAGIAMAAPASAQEADSAVESAPLAPVADAPDATPADANADTAAQEPNPDEMAARLNSQQQLKQTFTVTRTINGEVVETEKRTVIYSGDDPVRPSEAGTTAKEALRAAFDREVLTRNEAFEEAKLDYTVADSNRDNAVTADEFIALVASWREDAAREPTAADEASARERQYRAFVEELDPEAAAAEMQARARAKFDFMAGAAGTLSRKDYMREYLLDFDSMDRNTDMILRGDELMQFRALNRGEKL